MPARKNRVLATSAHVPRTCRASIADSPARLPWWRAFARMDSVAKMNVCDVRGPPVSGICRRQRLEPGKSGYFATQQQLIRARGAGRFRRPLHVS
jgi:hypothetical protein